MDRSVKIWDVLSTTPTCVQTLRFHEKAVKDATWSVQGREVLSGGYDRTARICDVEKGVTTSCCHHNDFVTSVKWHPVNHHLFVTGSRNVIKCWDKRNISRPAKIFMYKEVFGQVQDIAFLRDGSEFLCCTDTVARDSADRSIMAWHFNSGVVLSNQIFQERYTCTRLRMHPSEAQFVSQTQGGYIALFSTIKPYKMNKCKRFDAHQVLGYSVGCDFSPDGRLLASGSADGSLVCYDFHLARKITSLTQPGSVCLDVAWHPILFSTVATSSDDGTISVWQ
ncbi:WD repeat-containing protein 25 [Lamellibrachia satsuma]|nr:WD repeat-containing protein 25 [Lamellibrachia satsuma]